MSQLTMAKAGIAIIIPIFVSTICYKPKEFNIRKLNFREIDIKKLLLRILISLVPGAAIWLISNAVFPLWTVFGRALLEYLCVLALQFGIDFVNSKEKEKSIMYFLFLSVMGIVTYSVLTNGQATLHGDIATATLLAQAQVKYRQIFPDSWCYVNGDIWLLASNLTTLPFSLLMHNQSLARMLGSLLLLFLTCLGVYITSRKFFHNDSWLISIPIFVIATFGQYDMTIYQVAYTSPMAFILIGIWFYYEAVYEKKRKYSAFFAVLIFLLMVTGIRYLAELLLPLMLAMITIDFFENNLQERPVKELAREYAKRLVILFGPAVIGLAAYKYICNTHIVINTNSNDIVFANSMNDCWNNLIAMFLGCFENFGYVGGLDLVELRGLRNMFSLGLTALVMFIIPVLQFKVISKESRQVKLFFTFTIFHNLEMLLMGVLFSHTLPRYFLTSVFMFEIVSAVYLYNHRMEWKGSVYKIICFASVFMTIIYGGSLVQDSENWFTIVQDQKLMCDEIVSHGLKKGYASFWNAYKNEVFSDLRLSFASIGDGIHAGDSARGEQWWLVDSNRFTPDPGEKTFLLLNPYENGNIKDKLNDIYGSPIETFELKKQSELMGSRKEDKSDVPVTYYVYVWDYDITEKGINWLYDNKYEQQEVEESEYISKRDGEAYIKQGGAIQTGKEYLDKGTYELIVTGDNLKEAREEIYSDAQKYNKYISYEVTEKTDERIAIRLKTEKKIKQFRIRINNDNAEEIGFKELHIGGIK